MDATKIIVTHRGALEAKYGAAVARVLKAVEALIAADAARGILSRLVALDVAADMAPYHAPPMGRPDDREGAKRCVDAIDRAAEPHYFLILGCWDVVPMQWLFNTEGMLAGHGDPRKQLSLGDNDANVPSDLPYACDAKYSDDAAEFQGPTRVVGRLPDVPRAKNPEVLVKLLKLAAAARPLPREAYADWMALSTQTWRRSTRKTVMRLFGDDAKLVVSPPHYDRWAAKWLKPRLHFINCHGGSLRAAFVGEDDEMRQYNAISARTLRGKVTPGTVVASECCFGAQVFDPADTLEARDTGRTSMALEYLKQGAYGFFGSTTTAYGPAAGNDWADEICRLFMRKVLSGASLGRAALEARLDYLRFSRWDDPVKLKTLAQFHLLGDPSIHPVATGKAPGERAVVIPAAVQALVLRQRAVRRRKQREEGKLRYETRQRFAFLGLDVSAEVMHLLEEKAGELAMRGKLMRFFSLMADTEEAARGIASPAARARANTVVVVLDRIREEMSDAPAPGPLEVRRVPCYGGRVAYLRDGKLLTIKRIFSR